MKVLVVDDSAIMRKVIEQILEMLGHEAVPAANGVEAFERLKEHDDVKLILLDWNMPEMNGIEFLRAVKDRPGLAKIRSSCSPPSPSAAR
jgi:two-component system chemotaxis response regulator CheY